MARESRHGMIPGLQEFEGPRRGARAVESAGLESRCARKGTVGSNPTLSASLSRAVGPKRLRGEGGFGASLALSVKSHPYACQLCWAVGPKRLCGEGGFGGSSCSAPGWLELWVAGNLARSSGRRGEMRERFNRRAWKARVGVTPLPRVRIPLSPPAFFGPKAQESFAERGDSAHRFAQRRIPERGSSFRAKGPKR